MKHSLLLFLTMNEVLLIGPNLRDIPVKIEIPDDNDSDLFEITFTPITVGKSPLSNLIFIDF